MRLIWLLICSLLAASVASAQRQHLLLGPTFISNSEGAALHVNPAQRRELVIKPDRPWEQLMISFYLTDGN